MTNLTDRDIAAELKQIGEALESAGVVSNRLEVLRAQIECRISGGHRWQMTDTNLVCRHCGKTAATAQ